MNNKTTPLIIIIVTILVITAIIWLVLWQSIKPGNQNTNQLVGSRYCEQDSDCKCFSGRVCGCYNKNYTPIEIFKGLCDASCLLAPEIQCKCVNNQCTEVSTTEKDVTITTDKTEYQVGEEVKITITNNTSGSISLSCASPYDIQQYSEGKWQNIEMVAECGKEDLCLAGPEIIIVSKDKKEFTWEQVSSKCDGFKKIETQVSNGKYRIGLTYVIGENISTMHYSNEFTIKEQLTCGGFGDIECPDGYYCYIENQIVADAQGVCKSIEDYEEKCCKECYDNSFYDSRVSEGKIINCTEYKNLNHYYKMSNECIYYFEKYPHKVAECKLTGTNDKFITSYVGEYRQAENAVRDEIALNSLDVTLPLDKEEVCILAKEACGSNNCNNINKKDSIWSIELEPVCGATSAIIDEQNKTIICTCWFIE